jgi:formyl-CoA transferase
MAAIHTVKQAIEHPVAERMRIEVGGVAMLASPMRLSATPTRYDRPPPKLDAHRAEILAELGLAP